MELFAARLKWCRERKNLTQKQIAEMIGMTQSSYSKYEYNLREPKLDILAKLPPILNESSDFLIGVTDYTKNADILKSHFEDATGRVMAIMTDMQELKLNPRSTNIIFRDYNPDDPVSIAEKLSQLEKQLPLWRERMEIARQKVLSMLNEIPLVSEKSIREIRDESGWLTLLNVE